MWILLLYTNKHTAVLEIRKAHYYSPTPHDDILANDRIDDGGPIKLYIIIL
jgi:hypothetical protein